MRKLLNTLFVTTPDCYLSLDGNNIVILKEKETLFRIPVTNLENINGDFSYSRGYGGKDIDSPIPSKEIDI